MGKRNVMIGVAALLLVLAVIVAVQVGRTSGDRLAARAAEALREGDLAAAEDILAELADVTIDSMDLTAVMSLRVGLAIARIASFNQLSIEYAQLAHAFPEEHELHRAYMELSEGFRAKVKDQTDALEELARHYRGRHYQSGLRIQSPLRGQLDLGGAALTYEQAYDSLSVGDATPEAHRNLERSINRESVGFVLSQIIIQEGRSQGETVRLSGRFDMANLLWLIGANMSGEPLFARWCFERVIEETEHSPDHPARQLAFGALHQLGAFIN